LTGRDAAHKRMVEMLNKGESLPVDLKGRFIYYVGPVDPVGDEVVGPAGPTTATRMDKFTRQILEQTGLLGMIGKSERGPTAIEAIRDNKAHIDHQPVQPPPHPLLHPPPQGPGFPVLQADFAAHGKITGETVGHRKGKRRVDRLKVGFQIEAQIPVVEVARTHTHPIVDQHHLQVQEARLVFEYPHLRLEQARVVTVAGVANRWVIGARSGGQEIRRRQPDALLSGVQRAHQRLHDVLVLAGVGIRHAPQPLSARWRFGQARQTKIFRRPPCPSPGVGVKLPVEQHLPVHHHGAADFDHDLMPFTAVHVRAPEFLEFDLLLRAVDGGDHSREKSRAVNQQVELVFFAPREDRTPHERVAMAINSQASVALEAQAGEEGRRMGMRTPEALSRALPLRSALAAQPCGGDALAQAVFVNRAGQPLLDVAVAILRRRIHDEAA
nr:fumarate hydratase [Tanacetum cinerariifolium]